jgi:hypothetical protein
MDINCAQYIFFKKSRQTVIEQSMRGRDFGKEKITLSVSPNCKSQRLAQIDHCSEGGVNQDRIHVVLIRYLFDSRLGLSYSIDSLSSERVFMRAVISIMSYWFRAKQSVTNANDRAISV